MNLKSTLVVSATLLFVTAPAWADSVKSKTPDLAASSRTSSFSRSDIKRLGGFRTQDGRLVQMSGDDVVPDGDADDSTVSTPEPGSWRFCLPVCCALVRLGRLRTGAITLPPPRSFAR